MKFTRFIALLSIIVTAPMLIAGCHTTEDTYSFSQGIEEIETIDICKYDFENKTVTSIKTLSGTEKNAILNDISDLECYRHFGDHTMDYGEVVIYITYQNNESEVIGIWNVAQVDAYGKWHIGMVYFDDTVFCTMLVKYIDIDLVPELKQYLE